MFYSEYYSKVVLLGILFKIHYTQDRILDKLLDKMIQF